MTRPLTLLAAVAVPLALTLTALPAQADTPRARGTTAVFTLDAEVQDGGQQVVSLTVDARRLGLSPGGLSEDTFRVTASGSVLASCVCLRGPTTAAAMRFALRGRPLSTRSSVRRAR